MSGTAPATGAAAGEAVPGGEEELLPRHLVGAVAILCAAVLMTLAALGPLGTSTIQYRTSQSGIWQTMGADAVNLLLIAPLLLVGGVLHMLRREAAKYLLILTPVTLMYTGMTVGIGQEWSAPSYAGNVERFSGLFLTLVIGGLILLVASVSMFSRRDAPDFNPRGLRIYVGVMGAFLVLFALMWLSELVSVLETGDAADGAYESAPTVWWTIRYFDLGISIPLGFLGLFLLLTRTKRAYPLVLLFFGFFVTMGSAVVAMGTVMVLNHDPQAQAAGMPIFVSLAVLAYGGLIYLVRHKLRWPVRAGARMGRPMTSSSRIKQP